MSIVLIFSKVNLIMKIMNFNTQKSCLPILRWASVLKLRFCVEMLALSLLLCGSFWINKGFAQLRQPDGSVIPARNSLSNFLNNPPLNEGINVINDASLVPEVFTPSDSLTFSFIAEGGGYENAFGWYNLGDDVTLPQNRFVIFNCSVEPVQPFVTSTINFCGNPQWKGGPIGFFLITPELRGGGTRRPNCAINDNRGYIYYSEPRLNIDEDPNSTFIHHLVYRSNSFPNAFYFGFEDLFRGGDNDFEDTLILVEGLLVGDAPENCDGADDDCDGRIDEGAEQSCSTLCGQGIQLCVEGVLGGCSAPEPSEEVCDGVDNDCDGQLDEGLTQRCVSSCGEGLEVCVAGEWSGCTAQTPRNENCNNVDEDCDGTVDEGLSIDCVNGCGVAGQRACVAGSFGQCDAPAPQAESCDGQDNDCDGQIDEALYESCQNECGLGVAQCVNGEFVNCNAPEPNTESCDALDNDCDGQIDENLTQTCSGTCGVAGLEQCAAGLWIACTAPQARPEACNLIDDDCDGQVDENLVQTCQNNCGAGQQSCVNGAWSVCDAPLPQQESCDNLDNDCDGRVDESLVKACQNECGQATQLCIGGTYTACNLAPPQEERCDNLDNDCDGLIDENLERACDSLCGAGNELCVSGSWVDCNAPVPRPESCNALDDDCDGLIDELLIRACDNPCGEGTSACELGRWSECPASSASEERCDASDNDCDGLSDENVICPDPQAICVRGECALPCQSRECPIGQECIDDVCLEIPCQNCRRFEICENDRCIDLCSQVTCGADQFCRAGECIDGDCYTQECEEGKVCINGQCQADDCDLVNCGLGQACLEGRCFETCAQSQCANNEICIRGECLADACEGINCATGERCEAGGCIADLCDDVLCPQGRRCEDAACVPDLCLATKCPAETQCINLGNGIVDCVTILSESTVTSGSSEETTSLELNESEETQDGVNLESESNNSEQVAESVSGCDQGYYSASSSMRSLNFYLMMLGIYFFALSRKRHFKVRRFIISFLTAVFVLQACNETQSKDEQVNTGGETTNAFTINGCAPTLEICNGIDDDCDGEVDNVSNLDRDPENCGECGQVCELEQGEAICVNSQCRLARCLPGFVNADGRSVNGCEASCELNTELNPTGDDTNDECNQRDDDCDGLIDEGFNLGQDPNHCGACGVSCLTTGVAEASCLSGRCVISACEEGYINLDGQANNGCEYSCNGADGAEVCNGADDDCDGQVDEAIEININCLNQGLCAGISPECRGDDGIICAYPEEVNLGGEIRCDGRDEDCDGLIDEDFLGLGEPCDGDDSDQCLNGVVICSSDRSTVICQERIQEEERCDRVDNDCDERIDEGFILLFDTRNCGVCGNICPSLNAESACRDGECLILSCNEGYQDLDQDPSTGCEYACTPTSVDELCDGIDNDCDGLVDESVNVPVDISCLNQGVCSGSVVTCLGQDGFVCVYPDSYEVGQESQCDGSDNDCDGVIDEDFPNLGSLCDGNDQDLCLGGVLRCNSELNALDSTECTDDEESIVETCDGIDNDCDGSTDEDFDLQNDSGNCGQCGLSCSRDSADTRCNEGVCEIVSCVENRYDLNQVSFDGCEYDCVASSDQNELCNGIDDDCDGRIDEELNPPLDLDCAGAGVCQGVLPTCKGISGFQCEFPLEVYQMVETRCDQLDNDCDGQVDEDNPQSELANLGEICSAGIGACYRQGVQICNQDQSSTICSAKAADPAPEQCNGIDDDCDGVIDEDISRESEMVAVILNGRIFWMDRWEASRPDASAESQGLDVSRACSKAGVLPWANLTLNEAHSACEARGKRLCTDSEWQFACGEVYPYGDQYNAQACVSESASAAVTGSLASCESQSGIFDLSGNLAEWTSCERNQDCQIVNPQLGGSYADRIIDLWRCDFRGNAVPTIATATAGFRCCVDP